mmetsp:Transcript_20265/g.66066  ORF Transcript_20265/g.66066 Transcript_20265/m.66066 type:complete len:248 (-) Transcript_20265:265-1008(-)
MAAHNLLRDGDDGAVCRTLHVLREHRPDPSLYLGDGERSVPRRVPGLEESSCQHAAWLHRAAHRLVVLGRQEPAGVRPSAGALQPRREERARAPLEAVQDGHRVWHMQVRHVVVRHLVEGGHQGADGVCVRDHDHGAVTARRVRLLEERGRDALAEALEHAALAVCEALSSRRGRRPPLRVVGVEWRRLAVHAAPPAADRLLAVCGEQPGVILPIALHGAVVALVETRITPDALGRPRVLPVPRHRS